MIKILKFLIKKIFFKFKFFVFFKGNRFIFLFHDISDYNSLHYSDHYSISKKNFIDQLNLIKKNFKIISLNQLVTNTKLSNFENYASITFDDGF